MKVCTDACVLGACADVGTGGRVLDIGTGTGLLALMAAQRNPTALVDAVEVDDAAFGQAVENVSASEFAERVRVIHSRIQDFQTPVLYDRIIANPPFYTKHLRSPDAATNRALHTDELSLDDLIQAVARLLKPDGQWWVLLPSYETRVLTNLAQETGLFPFRQLALQHTAQKPVFRIITGFSFHQHPLLTDELAVYETDNKTYTLAFRTLLRDFYLIF